LESWIDATVAQDGMSQEALIIRIKESYRRSLQANIDYHSMMAERCKAAGEAGAEKRHTTLMNVYMALIKP
jgi:hypothetical protein